MPQPTGQPAAAATDKHLAGVDGSRGLDQRLRDLATYVKSQGITIYAIQYYYDDGPLASLMKDVASEPDAPYYHFAPDAAALDQVFQEIANHLSNLRLSM